jgi:Cu-Zn family superoxide dismutase
MIQRRDTVKIASVLGAALIAAAALPAQAEDITIKMRAISAEGIGKEVGTVRAVDTPKGLLLVPRLSGLKPGPHGFHVHENPSCAPKKGPDGKPVPGLAAGGHFDPEKTGKHEGPAGKGHFGDLPALTVDDQGNAKKAVTAPRLKVADLWGRSLMIHAGGDNYSDQPAALGGGGGRVACGRIVKGTAKKM